MGEVYKARDTRLDRTVAIKVLPAQFAADPQFRERFEREARAISQLDHPHICALYDVGEQDGTSFLVMQYLEGETLAARLDNGALAVDDALRIAAQIADALDKAHRQGIIHRDLKPGNIFLCSRGPTPARARSAADAPRAGRGRHADENVSAKVLDFGLAKVGPGGGVRLQADLSAVPTTPPSLTAQGTILGTFQYMAPEQLEGKEADARTDIFAFGATLYEMLTGRKAFEGKSHASLIGAILKDTPPPISSLLDSAARERLRPMPSADARGMSGGVPGARTVRAGVLERWWGPASAEMLDRVVSTCLAKDPDDRWQTARDLLRELKWVAEDTSAPTAVTVAPRAKSRERLAWTVGVVLAVAVVATVALPYVRAPAAAPEMRLEINTPATTDPISFAISPDGRRLVFVASGDGPSRLWLRSLDAVTAQPLAGTEGATYPFWSPDSRSIGFFAAGKLKRTDISGGLPQTLADVNPGRGGTWSPDGVILFPPSSAGPLFRVAASGGAAVALTKVDIPRQAAHRFPQFLPGGRQFLFYVQGTPEVQGIYLGSLDSPETKRLTAADTAGAYAPPGWLLFVRQRTLVAQRFDLSRGELTGDPVMVADPVGFDANFNLGAFSVSAAGLVTYRAGEASRRQLAWFDRSGKALGTLGAPDESGLLAPALSPDGRRVAVQRTVQGNTDVWLLDAVRSTRFSFDASVDRFPIWSPDGSRIVFQSTRTGGGDLYEKPSSGAGSERLLLESPLTKTATDWSSDGRFLLYAVSNDPKTGFDVWVLPLDGDRKPFVFLNATFEERVGQFSPDGRWVAYQTNESGRHEIYVRPFPGPGGRWQVSTAGGIQPRWRRDGKEIYYIAPDAKLMAVPITASGATLEPGTPVALFQTRVWGGGTETYAREQYDVAPDGRFLIIVATDEATPSPITVILNWAAGLNK